MSENPSSSVLELEYAALRQEILQSISYQHQILLGGYGSVGVYIGYILGKPVEYFTALIAVPFILLGMASLWIVECSRMVRASYYIGRILWPALRACIPPHDNPHHRAAGWEHWIRSATGKPDKFRLRQHRAQSVVVLWGPIGVSLITSALAIHESYFLHLSPSQHEVTASLGLALIAGVLWLLISVDLRHISDLGRTAFSTTPLDDLPPEQNDNNDGLPPRAESLPAGDLSQAQTKAQNEMA